MKQKLLFTFIGLAISTGLCAANQVVINNNDSGVGSLRQAISDVGVGEEITFNLSAGNETIVISTELLITKNLTIDGTNSSGSGTAVTVQVTVPGANGTYSRVFRIGDLDNSFTPTVTIENMTIKGGDLYIDGSQYHYGGGIYVDSESTLTINNSAVSGSEAYDGGGIYINGGGSLIAESLTVVNCNATDFGGGISLESFVTAALTDCVISGNSITKDQSNQGGGIYANWVTSLTITNSTISDNHNDISATGAQGGGIIFRFGGTLTITGSTISGNTSEATGGGIYLEDYGTVNISDVTISNNSAGTAGGGVYVTGSGSLAITSSTINENTTDGYGGGIINWGGNTEIVNSTLSDNASIYDGGCIYNMSGTISVTNSTIANNTTSTGSGGGISNGAALTIKNSLFVNNTATTYPTSADYHYWNGTVTDNGFNVVGYSNVAANATGGFNATTDILYNTKYNDATTSNTSWTSGGTTLGNQSLNLAATLANNGGPTLTLTINTGSFAIASGIADVSVTVDQRGETRHDPPTIGAFEYFGNIIWYGFASTTDWNTPGNWDMGIVPLDGDDVTIPGSLSYYPVINWHEGASCQNLTVGSGASLTVESGGSLITEGPISNEGVIDVKRNITEESWHLISIPTVTANANVFLGDYLQGWDESDALWSEIIPAITPLVPVHGYALWATTGKSDFTYTFTGIPNTGNQSLSFTAEKQYGWNLMGNPYPSYLDWDAVIASQTNMNGGVYFYNGTTYVSYNNGLGGGSRYIAPMQGFFISATSDGTFNLSNSHRTHTSGTFYKEKDIPDHYLRLITNGNNITDELHIRFNETATQYFDGQYDAWKLLSWHEQAPQLYSFSGSDILSIDQRPACGMIQLGFFAGNSGVYSIAVDEMTDFFTATLEDTKTNTHHNLTKGQYEFLWEITDDETRFKLYLNAVGIEETPISESNIMIYTANDQIFIKGTESCEVIVSDVTGRIIGKKEIAGSGLIPFPVNLKTGIYLVMVKSKGEVKTKKIFIR